MAPFNWFNRRFSDSSASEEAEKAIDQPTTDQPETGESAEATSETTAPPAPAPAAADEARLQWAKAAFENIRKRQQQDAVTQASQPAAAPTPTETAPPATPPEEAEAVASPESDRPIAEEPATDDLTSKPDRPEPVVADVSIAEPEVAETVSSLSEVPTAEDTVTPEGPVSAPVASEDTPEPVVHEPSAEEETPPPPAPEPEPIAPMALATDPPAPLPFWAQAEAERLERLERLKAEAINDTPPPPVAVAPESVEEPLALLDLNLDEAFLWSSEILAAQGRRPDQISIEEITWLKRLRQGLDKTRRGLVNQLRAIVGQGPLNEEAVLEIESLLLQADVGVEATDAIIESLQAKLRQETLPPSEAIAYLKTLLREMLDQPLGQSHSLGFVPEKDKLNIWLITGVNGAGKTTTIGKVAHIAQKSGYRCLIAAADTFRAAAVQQVKVWGERSQVEVIANPGKNTDPAAVVFDAITAAQTRQTELLLVDTAGRLQNKKNLMDELSKIRRIIDKKAPDAIVESLLVLDSTLGQNGLRQAQVFSEVAKLSGVILTKLDGSAKGGVALAVVKQLGLPIRFIGAGEGIEDLRPFSSYEFVEALLNG